MSDATTGPCLICNKANSTRCDKCQSAFYCSKQCQKADWPVHKLLCTAFKNFDMSTRPSEDHFRAIRLPVDKAKPEVIWLLCERYYESERDDSTFDQFPASKDLVADGGRHLGLMHIQFNAVLGRHLPDIVCLNYRDTFLYDGSATNESVAAITSTKPVGPNAYWRSDMTAYGTVGHHFNGPSCRDLDLNDFRHLADHLISYGPMPSGFDPRPSLAPYTRVAVQGVRINCLGDQTMFDRPHFEPITVDYPSDPVFYQAQPEAPGVAKLVDIPVFTRKLLPNWEDWAAMGGMRDLARGNRPAQMLHLACFSSPAEALSIGDFHPFVTEPGSVLVVRQDQKPLSALHVEALCDYCERAVLPIIAQAEHLHLTEAQARALVSPREFTAWWDKFCEEKKVDKNKAKATPYKV